MADQIVGQVPVVEHPAMKIIDAVERELRIERKVQDDDPAIMSKIAEAVPTLAREHPELIKEWRNYNDRAKAQGHAPLQDIIALHMSPAKHYEMEHAEEKRRAFSWVHPTTGEVCYGPQPPEVSAYYESKYAPTRDNRGDPDFIRIRNSEGE